MAFVDNILVIKIYMIIIENLSGVINMSKAPEMEAFGQNLNVRLDGCMSKAL